VDDDGTDIERPALEGSPFKDFHDRPNGVIAAEIVVEPKLIEPVAAVTVEELDASRACAGHLGWPAVDERAEIVDEDDRRLAVSHRTMMPGLSQRLDPMSGSAAIRSLPLTGEVHGVVPLCGTTPDRFGCVRWSALLMQPTATATCSGARTPTRR
jgi:hypothetical protein